MLGLGFSVESVVSANCYPNYDGISLSISSVKRVMVLILGSRDGDFENMACHRCNVM